MNIREKLMNIQNELKAPKGQRNSFGNYNYRSCEDILEAVKPICKKNNAVITVGDELLQINERIFVEAIAIIHDCESEEIMVNKAYAEIDAHKGMSKDQCTGTASSYARKYALNGLLAIDDTKDADTNELGKIKKQVEDKEIINNSKNEFKVTTDENKVNEVHVNTLKFLLDKEENKGREEKLLKHYKVKALKDLNMDQFLEAMEMLGGNK